MEGDKKIITVVCTGNVCRSPMAERLLQHALASEAAPLSEYKVISAGVAAMPGDAASAHAITALKRVQLDLSDHRSRPLSDQLLEISDLILTMTSSHIDSITLFAPEIKSPVYRFREWTSGNDKEVIDPFGGPLNAYLETRDHLAEAIPSIIQFLKSSPL